MFKLNTCSPIYYGNALVFYILKTENGPIKSSFTLPKIKNNPRTPCDFYTQKHTH